MTELTKKRGGARRRTFKQKKGGRNASVPRSREVVPAPTVALTAAPTVATAAPTVTAAAPTAAPTVATAPTVAAPTVSPTTEEVFDAPGPGPVAPPGTPDIGEEGAVPDVPTRSEVAATRPSSLFDDLTIPDRIFSAVLTPPSATPAPPLSAEQRLESAREVVRIVNETALPEPTIVNPDSKFVFVTYWWGDMNLNNNVKHPCDQDMRDVVNEIKSYRYIQDISDPEEKLAAIREESIGAYKALIRKRFDQLKKQTPEKSDEEIEAELRKETPPLPFRTMIERWKEDCARVGVNYLVQEYPFGRPLYQAAINGKPAFIRKALDACKGKAVVYIDGDMRPNVYPKIFDMDGIDFMARGWNIDPRSSQKAYKSPPDVCFDPYMFETSGGIQYFADTPGSRELLDTWELSNFANPGKADDRVISIAFNLFKYQLPLSHFQLPIEYLWLTDNYLFQTDTNQTKAIVEHPECLTGEDVAAESGAASNRSPNHYDELIPEKTFCERFGGRFYEYIFFPEESLVDETLGPYLKYLKTAKNNDGDPMFEVISYADRYGPYNATVEANEAAASRVNLNDPITEFNIPQILAHLKAGNYVTIGDSPIIKEKISKGVNLEFIAKNIIKDDPNQENVVYPDLQPKFDMSGPFFFSAKNPVVQKLLAMCERPENLSEIFNSSYLFLSLIRCYWIR